MKFLIDMPVTPDAVRHLSAAGHQAVHTSELGLFSAPDEMILERARTDRSIVVTADLDFPRLIALQGAAGPGIILFRGGNYSDTDMLRLPDRVLAQIPAAHLEHSLTVVDRARIRRHALPGGE